tara:strand:- start:1015 stop:1857 length:843 start_codon:yes stop_codon:yes gene_type:complete
MKKKPYFNTGKFALLQGRLVDNEKKNEIQFFPHNKWKKELEIFDIHNLKYIEWVASLENLKKNPIFYKKKLKDIIIECRKNKINIRSIDAQFFVKKPFYKGSKFEMKKRFNTLKKILLHSQTLKIKFFIIPALENAKIETNKQKKIFINGLKKLSNLVNKNSYILIESDLSPKKLNNFINEIDKENIGINYDTGNSAGNGFNFDDEKKYFSKVKNIHLKDKKFNGKSIRLGKGDFRFKKFFKFLKQSNYKGFFAFQCARSIKNNHLEEFLINLNYIKKFI